MIPCPPIMRGNRLQDLLPPTPAERLAEYQRKAALVGRARHFRAWSGPLPKADDATCWHTPPGDWIESDNDKGE